MAYIADLHIHSRFSRACSQQLNVPNLVQWSKLKGIDLLGTGDFLHPLWLTELKSQLKEDGSGFLTYPQDRSVKLILSVEIASMYSHHGRGRRVHNVVLLPDFASADRFQKELLGRRATLGSDGRPIVGISSKDLLSLALQVSEKAIFVTAHCILPSALVHAESGLKEIQKIKVGDLVYTHKNRKRKVTEVLKHQYHGKLHHIQPWYFSLGLEATSEHPFLAFKVKQCLTTRDRCIPTRAHKAVCTHSFYKEYKPGWLLAKDLEVGDMLVFPRFRNTTPMPILPIDQVLPYVHKGNLIHTGGSRGYVFNKNLSINEGFCRLVGYYLAEGWVSLARGEVGFAFSEDELDYINEVKESIKNVFGITHSRLYKRVDSKGAELIFSSKLVAELFAKLFYTHTPFRAYNKTLPDWMLHLPENLQAQLLLNWWRGDHGYTTSRQLMNQMKIICLRLGIIPSIGVDKAEDHLKRGNHNFEGRIIKASTDTYYFSRLAFFEDTFNLLSDPSFKDSRRKLDRKHGWIDENYVYLPIREISTREYQGEVFNLEVEEDHSYVTEFATVHNCWTPWFGVFGSESGYDSLEECFEDLTKYVYGVETGLSSSPAMNWRIAELDNRSILSSSDAHSLPNLGRESTVFDLAEFTYDNLWKAITQPSVIASGRESSGFSSKQSSPEIKEIATLRQAQGKLPRNDKVIGTIEFYPEEGKYHYTGHRNCNVKYSPEDTKTKGTTCPVCGQGLTVGVMERVEKLANREVGELGEVREDGVIKTKKLNRPGYRMLVPLLQIIAEALSSAPTTQKVLTEYKKLTVSLGSEIKILTKVDIADISRLSGEKIAEGVGKVRMGDLVIDPGYDGVYGVVKIWGHEDRGVDEKEDVPQLGLFD